MAVSTPATPEAEGPVGISPAFNSVLHIVRRVAPTNATVLFAGESGVGKEVFARMLHRLSARSHKPFIALNCAALPEQLVESELFGVERGAFTGALQTRAGRFERADGGTLFLDEIQILSPSAQGKLLRVLQEGEFERLGDSHTRRVDVRVIAAGNRDLRQAVAAGVFREDLFFRLNVFPIRIAPLRERPEDIPLLMAHFLAKFNRLHGRHVTGFTQRAVDAMLSYDWPGNVREVENVIERGVILAEETGAIDAPHLFTSGERFGDKRYGLDREGKLVRSDPAELLTAGEPRRGGRARVQPPEESAARPGKRGRQGVAGRHRDTTPQEGGGARGRQPVRGGEVTGHHPAADGVPAEEPRHRRTKSSSGTRLPSAAADEAGCDLIFMASHGRRGLAGLLIGSETQKVLTHTKIPVLVYR